MKYAQHVIILIMMLFGGAQAYKYFASSATRAACTNYKYGAEFSAVTFVKYAVEHNSRDAVFSELSAPVPNPTNVDDPVTTVAVVTRAIKRDSVVPAAFTRIDQLGLKGKATLVTKVGFAMYTCNISFADGKVTSSLGTW